MKENWIEDVLMDLSKSAFNEGRLDLCMAIDDFIKTAVANTDEVHKDDSEIEKPHILDVSTKRPKADILCFHEYRKKMKIKSRG